MLGSIRIHTDLVSHANAHCVMKVLKGTLKETLYTWPEQDKAPQVIRETLYPTDGVTYMSDQLGLHKVSNPDPDNFAISLHRRSSRPLPPILVD